MQSEVEGRMMVELAKKDFVVDNPEGLTDIDPEGTTPGDSWNKVCDMVVQLLADGLPIMAVVSRIAYSMHATRLLGMLARWCRNKTDGENWQKFCDALLQMNEEWWHQSGISTNAAANLINNGGTEAIIHSAHIGLLLSDDHPLFGLIIPNDYYSNTVKHALFLNQFLLAWERLCAAAHGKQRVDVPPPPINKLHCKVGRTLWAGTSTLAALVREVFTTMVGEGLVNPLPTDNKGAIYRHKTRWVRNYHGRVEIAGFSFALLFCTKIGGEWPGNEHPYEFSPPGEMVLRLAAYFRENYRRERKRGR